MPPDQGRDPAVWLATARDMLAAAEVPANPIRIRCFCGQRAVELALKGLLIHYGIEFPYTHGLHRLLVLLPGEVPEHIQAASDLTPYAIEEMYPDTFTGLDVDHAAEAVERARAVVEWTASIIESAPPD